MTQQRDHRKSSATAARADGLALRRIPVRTAPAPAASCAGEEAFALQVLGSDMAPEFADGDIIIVEPEGLVSDGSYVVARHDGEWLFRQIVRRDAGWVLVALAAGVPERVLQSLDAVRGVVIEKTRPGRRRERKRYVD